MSNSTSDAPERGWDAAIVEAQQQIAALRRSITVFKEYKDLGVEFPEPDQRVHQQSDLQCVKCGSQMELQHVCEHCGHREANTDQQSDRLARITGIVQTWASADPDAIDDLDALCRTAEVLGVEVEARTYPPVDEKE